MRSLRRGCPPLSHDGTVAGVVCLLVFIGMAIAARYPLVLFIGTRGHTVTHHVTT